MGSWRRLPLAALAVLAVVPLTGMTLATSGAGSGLLSNGTFEGSGSGSLSGWKQVSSSLSLAHDGVGGGYAAKASFVSSKSYGIIAAPRPVVKSSQAGMVYTADGQIRSDTPGKKACLRLFEVTPAGKTLAYKESCVTTQSGWQSFPSLDYTAQGSGNSIAFRILQTAGAAGNSFEVDNLSLSGGAAGGPSAPSAPTNLKATGVSSSEIDLSWTASTSSGVTAYKVSRDGANVATVNAPTVTYKDTGLAAGTTHTYTVQAVDSTGTTSPASNTATASTTASNGTNSGSNLLSNPDFEGTGSGSLTGWTKVSSTLTLAHDGVGGGYAAKAAFTGSKNYGLIAAPRPVNKTSTAGTTYTATGQVRSDTPGKQACLRLFEVNSSGATVAFKEQCVTTQSTWQSFPSVSYTAAASGNSIAFRILQSSGASGNSFEVDNLSLVAGSTQQAPAAPTNLQASAVSSSEIDLSWTASTSSGVTGYQVNRDGSSVATLGASATSYKDTGLAASTSHTYTVQAIAGSLVSTPSNQASATTLAAAKPAAPTNLQASTVSTSEIDLSWTASTTSGVDSYQINRDGSPFTVVTAPATTYKDTGLADGSTHSYTVQALAGGVASDATSSVSATTKPLAPTGLQANAVSSSEIDLSWTASTTSTVTGYQVNRDGSSLTTLGPNATSYQDTGLAPSSQHTYTVQALVGTQASDPSGSAQATTSATGAPAAPTNLQATTASTSEIDLSWTASTTTGVTGYQINRDGSQYQTVAGTQTSFQDTGLNPGETHSYTVQALVATVASNPTASVSATTKPLAPTGLQANAVSTSEIDLSWTASTTSTVTGYQVNRDGSSVATLGANATSYQDTGLAAGTSHTYTVQALVNGQASDPSTSAQATTQSTQSDLISNSTFEGSGTGSLNGWAAFNTATLSLANDGVGGGWAAKAAFAGSASYGLKLSPLAVSKATVAGTVYTGSGMVRSDVAGNQICLRVFEVATGGSTVVSDKQCVTATSSWTALPVTGITAQRDGDSISFQVMQTGGVSGDSFEADNLTLVADTSNPVPSAPTNLQATATSSSEIDLSWTASTTSGVTAYKVTRDGNVVATVNAPATTYKDTGLAAGTSHTYTVAAVGADGTTLSAPSNQASATTLTAGPAAPTNLQVTNVTSSEVDLSWTKSSSSNVVSYTVNRNGQPLATIPAPGTTTVTYQDTSVNPSTSYSYTVQAIDSAQNASPPSNTVTATTLSGGGGGSITIGAVGDMACNPSNPGWNGGNGQTSVCGQKRTSDAMLADKSLQFILGLGDYQYDCMESDALAASYTPTWGRLTNLMRPVAGNHEYKTTTDQWSGEACPSSNATAQPYFNYFGAAAHPETAGHFSFNAGNWHIIALNGNCGNSGVGGCGSTSPQTQWLQSDISSTTQPCILAYWHQPYFTATPANKQTAYQPWWNILYAAHADLVLNGHIHLYARFPLLNASGNPDPNGIREVIAGTGGEDLGGGSTTANPAPSIILKTFGYLKLTLASNSYTGSFINASSGATTDSFSGTCH